MLRKDGSFHKNRRTVNPNIPNQRTRRGPVFVGIPVVYGGEDVNPYSALPTLIEEYAKGEVEVDTTPGPQTMLADFA